MGAKGGGYRGLRSVAVHYCHCQDSERRVCRGNLGRLEAEGPLNVRRTTTLVVCIQTEAALNFRWPTYSVTMVKQSGSS